MTIARYANGYAERVEIELPEIDGVDYDNDTLALEVLVSWSDGSTVTLPTWSFDRPNRIATMVPTGVEFPTAGLVTLTPNLTGPEPLP